MFTLWPDSYLTAPPLKIKGRVKNESEQVVCRECTSISNIAFNKAKAIHLRFNTIQILVNYFLNN